MNEKRFHFCAEFITLAIKYVPATMYDTLAPNMFMSRAYAKMQLKEFERALADLKTIVKYPDMPKVSYAIRIKNHGQVDKLPG